MSVLSRSSMCAVILVMTAACTVHQSDQAPPLTGPSTFAQSINVTATPDLITQDGQSQSAISVRVFGPNGQPMSAIALRIDILVNGTVVDYGTLSTKSIVTGTDGRATTVYTAPPAPPPTAQTESTVTIRATAIGTDTPSSAPFSAPIRLVPPGVILPPAQTPTPDFSVTPTPVNLNVPAIFDASASCGGAVINGGCSGSSPISSYAWTFGDGSSGAGKTVSHTYVTTGTFNATLTIANERGIAASKTQAITVGATAAPTASFVFSPAAPQIGQGVVFNADASRAAVGRTLVSYSWNFGDGDTASGAGDTHAFAAAGLYNVTLTVTDDVGQKGTTFQSVTVIPGTSSGSLTAAFVFSPTSPQVGQTVNFNADASRAAAGRTIASYSWNFGDGSTGTGVIAAHAFGTAGAYIVTLTVLDDVGQKGTTSQTVTTGAAPATLPTPRFTFSPAAPGVNELVFFNGSTSTPGAGHTIASYTWTFGDGGTATGSTAMHPYASPGVYAAQLKVTDDAGQSVTSDSQPVTVGNPPAPTAHFTISPTNPVVDQQIVFDAATSTPGGQGQAIVSYAWNFGDGTTTITPAATRTILHSFPTPQTYTVNLVVTDSAGRTGSTQQTVTVTTANPTARLSLIKAGGLNIQADGSASTATGMSRIVTYRFSWGDSSPDTTSAAPVFPHSYLAPGSYTVLLTVTDDFVPSRSGTISQTIVVP